MKIKHNGKQIKLSKKDITNLFKFYESVTAYLDVDGEREALDAASCMLYNTDNSNKK